MLGFLRFFQSVMCEAICAFYTQDSRVQGQKFELSLKLVAGSRLFLVRDVTFCFYAYLSSEWRDNH